MIVTGVTGDCGLTESAQSSMKIVITCPSFKELGGVANHYKGLKGFFTENVLFQTVGKRNGISGALLFPMDLVGFVIKLLLNRPGVVVINPSLAPKAVRRDFLLLSVAKSLNWKVVVFIHGWSGLYEKEFFESKYRLRIEKANAVLVLANEFEEKLRACGVRAKVFLATTKVDDKLLGGWSKETLRRKNRGSRSQILFLARITKEKGIYDAIESIRRLESENTTPRFSLNVVGDGPELRNAVEYAHRLKLNNVIFHGRLEGESLSRMFEKSDIYLFPSYHDEGMPTSLLEAMAFGLPIVTTNVGGIKDFFVESKMGYYCRQNDCESIVEALKKVTANPETADEISMFNYEYARERFYASKVALHLEDILRSI